MRAALIAHKSDCDPGLVGVALRERGYSFIEYMREDSGQWRDQIDEILAQCDLVVSLGSGWSTYWPGVSEHVAAEAELLRRAHHHGVRVLGICFGAQVLSTALGGTVDKSSEPEIGWYPVRPQTPAIVGDLDSSAVTSTGASESKELQSESLSGPWLQWHYDRFSVPDGWKMYADSPAGPQIIHSGRSVGVQFHPEATESIVARWSEGTGLDELAAVGVDPSDLFERTCREVPEAAQRCDGFIEWFFDITQ